MAHDCRYDPLRKTKLNHLPPRTFTTDDMEISPNSSPLSDGSSTKFPPNRQFSPQKSNMSFCSPGTLSLQRPRDCKSKAAVVPCREIGQKPGTSHTLMPLFLVLVSLLLRCHSFNCGGSNFTYLHNAKVEFSFQGNVGYPNSFHQHEFYRTLVLYFYSQ